MSYTFSAGSIRLSLPAIPNQPSHGFSFKPSIARLVQRRAVEGYRSLLSGLLNRQGYEVEFGVIEHDANGGGWSIHFRAADPDEVLVIHTTAMAERLDTANLYGFDGDDLIKGWLRRIETRLSAMATPMLDDSHDHH